MSKIVVQSIVAAEAGTVGNDGLAREAVEVVGRGRRDVARAAVLVLLLSRHHFRGVDDPHPNEGGNGDGGAGEQDHDRNAQHCSAVILLGRRLSVIFGDVQLFAPGKNYEVFEVKKKQNILFSYLMPFLCSLTET